MSTAERELSLSIKFQRRYYVPLEPSHWEGYALQRLFYHTSQNMVHRGHKCTKSYSWLWLNFSQTPGFYYKRSRKDQKKRLQNYF
jgi:hypothetical protein